MEQGIVVVQVHEDDGATMLMVPLRSPSVSETLKILRERYDTLYGAKKLVEQIVDHTPSFAMFNRIEMIEAQRLFPVVRFFHGEWQVVAP
jgi:hypothetical protein